MLTMILQTLAAGIGTVAFCVLFRVPQKYFLSCGFIGVVEWIVYLYGTQLTDSMTMGVFLAALSVVFLSRYFAVRKECPITMFLITGIFPLVPGRGIYRTVYYSLTEIYTLAIKEGFDSLKAAFAIAIAVAIGLRLPTQLFLWMSGKNKTTTQEKTANQKC